jgi:hypothetical protein
MYSVKETTEVLAALELILVSGKKILADGKVSILDLPVAMDLLGKLSQVTVAIEGAEQIPAEIKDLSVEETQELVAKVFAVLAAVKAA